MSDIIKHEPELQFSKEDTKAANKLKHKITTLISDIRGSLEALEHNYVWLGEALCEIRDKKYYLLYGFERFGPYMKSIESQMDRKRSQLYQYIGVSEILGPHISSDDLATMGISKAIELAKGCRQSNRIPTKELVARAVDPHVTEDLFKADVFEVYHAGSSPHVGTYRDLGGFYAEQDEWTEMKKVFDLAAMQDPPIPNTVPGWARMKEIVQRLCMEFWSTYGAGNGTS